MIVPLVLQLRMGSASGAANATRPPSDRGSDFGRDCSIDYSTKSCSTPFPSSWAGLYQGNHDARKRSLATGQSGRFSGADAALGYLYQCRVALLSALRRVRDGNDFILELETLDDVVFQSEGNAPALLQTKHHRTRKSDVTDASSDIWKTLRVWSQGTADGTIPVSSSLYLITTALAPAGSAASYLRTEARDPGKALERLEAAAQTSTNTANQPAYKAFLALPRNRRRELLEAVFVVDAAAEIIDLGQELFREVRWAVELNHIEAFLSRLEGWWLRRAIRQLSALTTDAILSKEIEAQVDDLREQFKRDALPIDDDILSTRVDGSEYADAVFVRQLQLIGIGAQRVLAAIREYFRAFEQRSRWLREDLLLVGELETYERRLIEEWELVFERMKDELGHDAAEEVKQPVLVGTQSSWTASATSSTFPS
jgi:hypothetical protein